MDGSGSGSSKLFVRFTDQAHRVLDRAREEAERASQLRDAVTSQLGGVQR